MQWDIRLSLLKALKLNWGINNYHVKTKLVTITLLNVNENRIRRVDTTITYNINCVNKLYKSHHYSNLISMQLEQKRFCGFPKVLIRNCLCIITSVSRLSSYKMAIFFLQKSRFANYMKELLFVVFLEMRDANKKCFPMHLCKSLAS